MTTELPAPPRAEQRPYSYERHGVTHRGSLALAARPRLSRGRRRGRARLSQGRERLFRGGDGAAPAAGRDAVRGDEGPDQGGRPLGPGPRRRLALLVGVQARRAISHLVSQAGRRRRRRSSSSTSRPRPRARNISGSARSRSAPTAGCAATLVDDNGSERFKLRIRDLATGEDIETVTEVGIGQPVWTSDSARHRLHRGQRAIGAATAPATTGSATPPTEDRHPLRRDRGHRLLGRRRHARRTTA